MPSPAAGSRSSPAAMTVASTTRRSPPGWPPAGGRPWCAPSRPPGPGARPRSRRPSPRRWTWWRVTAWMPRCSAGSAGPARTGSCCCRPPRPASAATPTTPTAARRSPVPCTPAGVKAADIVVDGPSLRGVRPTHAAGLARGGQTRAGLRGPGRRQVGPAAGGHVLPDAVEERGDLVVLAALLVRPVGGEDVIRAPAEQEGVRALVRGTDLRPGDLVNQGRLPAAEREPLRVLLGATGRLPDEVEGGEHFDVDEAHAL